MHSFNRVPDLNDTGEKSIYYTLRIASAMCFLGHGAFGILTKPTWVNYFGVFGIDAANSFRLMPWVGTMDICMGIILMVYPVRAVIIWLVVWGLFTASLRPLSGEPLAEFIERAGNFGAPLAWLLLSDARSVRGALTPARSLDRSGSGKRKLMVICLRFLSCCILLGHGWLNLSGKVALVNQYQMLGFVHPSLAARYIGVLEIIAAGSVLLYPVRWVVMALLIWKITSELFYPRYELFEWVERGGSYGCLLALWWALGIKFPAMTGSDRFGAAGLIFKGSQERLPHFVTGKKQLSK